jgi:hypothetical protein
MSQSIYENAEWHIEQIALFNQEALSKPTKQRSRYYKASFFFASAVVESFVFLIVKNYVDKGNRIEYRSTNTYKPLCNVSGKNFLKEGIGEIVICEKVKENFVWKKDIDFFTLNNIGNRYKIFNKGLFRKLESIRKKRNRIHIQSLNKKDHHYSKKDVEHASLVLPDLIDLAQK